MKRNKIMALLVAMTVTVSTGTSAFAMSADKYKDVPKENERFEYVEDVVDLGIMDGKAEDEFGMKEDVERKDLVEYIYKMMKEPIVTGSVTYDDVADKDYKSALVYMSKHEIFEGLKSDFFKDNKFNEEEGITRAEAAVIFENVAKNLLKIDVEKDVAENLDNFEDNKDVANEYVEAVKWAVGNKLLVVRESKDGLDEHKLLPNEVINKEEVAEIISKLLDMVKDETVDVVKPEITPSNTNKGNGADTVSSATKKNGTTPVAKKDNTVSNKDNTGSSASTEAKHTHNWVSKEVAEKGHYITKTLKDAWTEYIEHKEEGHYEEVEVEPAKYHVEEVVNVAEQGHIETTFHPEKSHEEKVLVSPEESHIEEVHHPEEFHMETVHHEAETHTVEHPEEYHMVDHPEEFHMETVNHPEESHIEIKHHDAVTHTVNHDEEFHYETVNHPEESHMETIHHEEVGHTVHHEAEGYYNTIHHEEISHEEIRVFCGGCGSYIENTPEALDAHEIYHILKGEAIHYTDKVVKIVDQPAYDEQVWVETKAAWDEWVVDQEAWDEQVKVVDKAAWSEQVKVVDKEAWTETVVDVPAWDEEIKVVDKEAWSEQVKVVDKAAWSEKVVDKAAWTETIVDKEAWDEEVKVVDKEAWTEKVKVIDKEAVYETKKVIDQAAWAEHKWVVDVPQQSDFIEVKDSDAVVEKKWVVDKKAWTEAIEHKAETKQVWVVDVKAHTVTYCSGCGQEL